MGGRVARRHEGELRLRVEPARRPRGMDGDGGRPPGGPDAPPGFPALSRRYSTGESRPPASLQLHRDFPRAVGRAGDRRGPVHPGAAACARAAPKEVDPGQVSLPIPARYGVRGTALKNCTESRMPGGGGSRADGRSELGADPIAAASYRCPGVQPRWSGNVPWHPHSDLARTGRAPRAPVAFLWTALCRGDVGPPRGDPGRTW